MAVSGEKMTSFFLSFVIIFCLTLFLFCSNLGNRGGGERFRGVLGLMFDVWEEAKANEAKRGKAEMRKLIEKYGFDLNEDDMELGDSVAYQMFEKYEKTAKREMADQIMGAIKDLKRNYYDMKKDNTVGADDYFHCKANFEATQYGEYGELIAEVLGDLKERSDYFKNRLIKGISAVDAYADYLHDKDVNLQGRQQAKNKLYKNAKEGCKYHRVKGINNVY